MENYRKVLSSKSQKYETPWVLYFPFVQGTMIHQWEVFSSVCTTTSNVFLNLLNNIQMSLVQSS